jgi:hypothetical protein
LVLQIKKIPQKQWNLPPHLIDHLKNEVWEQWNIVKNDRVFDNIKTFGENLFELGNKNNIPLLQEYGETLQSQAEIFDVAGMNSTLESYPQLLEQLKK